MFKRKSVRILPVNFCDNCNQFTLNESLIEAVKNNHIICVKEYLKLGASNTKEAFEYACVDGFLEIARILIGINCFNAGLKNACYGGQLHIAKWCVLNGATDFEIAVKESIQDTSLDNLDYLNKIECAKFCMKNGGAATWPLIYANAEGDDVFYDYCVNLVENGHSVDINLLLTFLLLKYEKPKNKERVKWCIRKGAFLNICIANARREFQLSNFNYIF